jgi:hypothetical protein
VYSADGWPAAALFSAASKISRAFSMNWLTRLYRSLLEKFERSRNFSVFSDYFLVISRVAQYTSTNAVLLGSQLYRGIQCRLIAVSMRWLCAP